MTTPTPALYDAKRAVFYVKPAMRGWLHLLWFAASLLSGSLLIRYAHGAAQRSADVVYAASVTALFGTSALYHRGNWSYAWNRRLQRLDHVMIFFLIAARFRAGDARHRPGGLPDCLVGDHLDRCRHPPGLDERARDPGRGGVRRARLVGRPRPACRVDASRRSARSADDRRWPFVHSRRSCLSPPLARPRSGSIWLSRSLPRVRLRCRGVPVHRDRDVHQLTSGGAAAWLTRAGR
jgi:Haemolysin-III related